MQVSIDILPIWYDFRDKAKIVIFHTPLHLTPVKRDPIRILP